MTRKEQKLYRRAHKLENFLLTLVNCRALDSYWAQKAWDMIDDGDSNESTD